MMVEGVTAGDVRTQLWSLLRDFIGEHRTYRNANWALPSDLIDRLETILDGLSPSDPVERNRWLFDDWLPAILTDEEDVSRRQAQIEDLRRQAVSETLRLKGIEGLVQLGITSKYPGFVAFAAVPAIDSLDALQATIEQAIATGEKGILLAGQLSGRARDLQREAWRDLVRSEAQIGKWPPTVVASLLVWWPDDKQTWQDAEDLGVAEEYWRQKRVSIIGGTPDDQTYQINRLIASGRATEAFHRVAMRAEDVPTDMLLRLFDAAIEEIAQTQTTEEKTRLGLASYNVGGFLAEMRGRTELPQIEVARREYLALPLLDISDAEGLTIHQFLVEDPGVLRRGPLPGVFAGPSRQK